MAEKNAKKNHDESPTEKRPYRRAIILLALTIPAVLVAYAAVIYLNLPDKAGEETSLEEFYEANERGELERAVLLVQDNRVVFTRDGEQHWVALPASQEFASSFVLTALDDELPLDIDQQVLKSTVAPLTAILPVVLLAASIVLVFLIIRSGGKSPFLKAAAKRGEQQRSVTFADVAGADEAITEIREVRDYLMDPTKLELIGAEAPHGVLLVGPPGTGKTLLARACAGEAGVPFFSMSGTDFVEMWVGVGAARVRDLFRQVRESAPAILFIDELDAIGRARSGSSGSAGSDERDQTLNQLLVEIDGFSTTSGVVIMGATNRPDILDKALLRQGRFDRQIVVDRPDRAGRLAILRVHAAKKRFEPSVELEQIAAQTTGFTGADLASLTNEAALLAARRGKAAIGLSELEEATDRVLVGNEGQSRRLGPAEKRAVAYHEAGHAMVAFTRPGGSPVSRISIVSRGDALGFTRIQPDEEQRLRGESSLRHDLAIRMGGRAAEALVLGEPTTSAKSDLRRATDLARSMVCQFGMSEALGQVALGRPGASPYLDDGSIIADYSGDVAATIDREIRRLVDEAYNEAYHLLQTHYEIFDSLAQELLAKETLRETELAPFVQAVVAGSHSPNGAEPPEPPADAPERKSAPRPRKTVRK